MVRAGLLTATALMGAVACVSQPYEQASRTDARSEPGGAPSVATIACGPDGAESGPSRVGARSDGVHLRLHNTSERDLRYRLRYADGSDQGGSLPPGKTGVVVPAPVGEMLVTCMISRTWHGPSHVIDVVDPHGYAATATLDCEGRNHGILDYVAGAKGEDDIVAFARRAFAHNLQPSDTVRELEYVGRGERVVAVERAGRTMARAEFFRMDRGGWLASSLDRCGDF